MDLQLNGRLVEEYCLTFDQQTDNYAVLGGVHIAEMSKL